MTKPVLTQMGLEGARPTHAVLIAWDALADSGNGDFIVLEAHPDGGLKSAPPANSFANIAGAATTVVKSGAGTLDRIVVNKAVASSTVTVYDNTAASGSKIATVTNPALLHADQYVLDYGCAFATGLTVVTSGADDITVIYR